MQSWFEKLPTKNIEAVETAVKEWVGSTLQQHSSAAPISVAQIMYSHGVVTSLAGSILNVQAASYNYCRLCVQEEHFWDEILLIMHWGVCLCWTGLWKLPPRLPCSYWSCVILTWCGKDKSFKLLVFWASWLLLSFAEVLRVNTLDFKETRNISEFALNSCSQLLRACSPQQCLNGGIYFYQFKMTQNHGISFSILFFNQLKVFSKMDWREENEPCSLESLFQSSFPVLCRRGDWGGAGGG